MLQQDVQTTLVSPDFSPKQQFQFQQFLNIDVCHFSYTKKASPQSETDLVYNNECDLGMLGFGCSCLTNKNTAKISIRKYDQSFYIFIFCVIQGIKQAYRQRVLQ